MKQIFQLLALVVFILSGVNINCYAQRATTSSPRCTVPAITGITSICLGDTTVFSNATAGGVWSSSNHSVATIDASSGTAYSVAAGTTTIIYTVGVCIVTATLTVNALPSSISGSTTICMGGINTLTNSTSGGSWSSSDESVASADPVTGDVTGMAIGTATITYSIGSCLSTIAVSVISSPSAYSVTGGGSFCSGDTTGVHIGTSGSDAGVNYQLFYGITPTGSPVAGSGTALDMGSYATAGGYTILATDATSGCSTSMTDSALLIANPKPTAYLVTGGGHYCADGTGVAVGLSNSDYGIDYQLFNGTTAVGSPLAGTASPLDFGIQSTAGTYTVVAIDTITMCINNMTDSVFISIDPLPSIITGHTNICSGTTTLRDSTTGGTWSSSNPSVIAISSGSGTVTASGPGSATITYALSSGCMATTTVTSSPSTSIISGTTTFCIGSTSTLADTAAGGTWSSGDTSVAVANPITGDVTGISSGTATITYTYGTGCTTTTTVTIMSGPAILPITGPTTVCTGSTITLHDATPGGFWFSSDRTIASISSTGVVRGVSSGTVSINYAVANMCGINEEFTTITVVSPLPITGTTTVCSGATTTLSNSVTGGTWSSNNAAVAVIGSGTGIVTGVTAGTARITYTIPCGVVTTTVTVNPAPNAGTIAGATNVCAGSTTTFTDAVTGGTWSSSTSIATVSAGVVTGATAGLATISYSVTNSCGTVYATKSITVDPMPDAGSISGSSTVCASATTTLTDAATGGTWSSSNSNATVSAGIVTGVTAGTATISYTVTNSCGSAVATKTITVSPTPDAGSISGASTVCTGATTALTDAAAGGAWSSSNSNATVTAGIVTGMATGTATISYSVTNSCGTATATKGITINPMPDAGTITGATGVCVDATITLTDTATGGTWSSSSANATVAAGLVTGVTAGTATISYTVTNSCGTAVATSIVTISPAPNAGTVTGSSSVCEGATITLTDAVSGGVWTCSNSNASVTAGAVTGITAGMATVSYTVTNSCGSASATKSIAINPAPDAGSIGGSTTVCVAATTTLTDAVAGGTWSSTSGATVASGVVTGVTPGTAMISYAVSNSCGTATATAAVTINPLPTAGTITGTTTVCTGATTTLADATTGGTWSSSNSNATVLAGVVSGITPGSASISYTVTNSCGTAATTADVTINPAPDAGSITGAGSVCAGAATTLTDAASGGAWTISGTHATVAAGVVSGISAGTTTVSYTVTNSCGTAVATANITVNPAPNAGSITGSTSVNTGTTTSMTNSISGGTWSMSNGNASISGTGVITGIAAGTDTVIYTFTNSCGTATATKTINISNSTAAITGTTTVCVGSSTTLSDATGGGTWSSSNASVASVDVATGVVYGYATGTATISYTVGSAFVTAVVTVHSLPASITGTTTLCAGTATTMSNTTTGGTWSSSDAAVASIDASAGSLSAIAAGSATVSYILGTGCFSTSLITVNAIPGTIGGTLNICAGAATTLTDAGSGTWSSSNTSVASIGISTGSTSGISAGTASISYTISGCSTTAIFTVNPLPSAISGLSPVCAGTTASLSSSPAGGTWSSSNSAVASVNTTTGVTVAISGGSTSITYTTAAGCVVTGSLTVNDILLITGATTVCQGSTILLNDASAGGSWSSSNASVAAVGSGSGLVSGISGPGTAIVSYTLPTGCTATSTITVNPLPASITGTAVTCAGTTTTLADATTGGVWCSGSTAIATVGSGTGIVSAVSGGSAMITYKLATGCMATTVFTVNPLPSAISGSTVICTGLNTTLGNTVAGGTWSSSNTAIATVGTSSGIVNGITTGTAIITYTVPCGYMTATVTVLTSSVPAISSVSSYQGYPSTSVTISGSNFNTVTTNNIVYFGATRAAVTAATSSSLTVSIPGGATFMPVTVENTGCLLTAYSQYPFLPTYDNSAYVAATIHYNAKVDFTSGTNPFAVATGDIDGDGKPDMVTANYSSNSISVYRNISTTGAITTASFAAKVDFTTGTGPYHVSIGDLDNDGKLDLVVVNNTATSVSVFRNTSTSGVINSSTLAAKVDFTTGSGPVGAAIGDIDKDGKADIVVANFGANTISVLRNTSVSGVISSSSFAAKVDFPDAINHPYGIALGDIDGDGKTDVVVPNQASANVSVYRNLSTPGSITTSSLATKVDFVTGSQPYSAAVGDIDGDGKLDIAVANSASASISILRNTSTGTTVSFSTKVDFTAGTTPYNIAIGDINGDGKPDIAVANAGSNTVSIFRNTATSGTLTTGSMAAKVDVATGTVPRSIAICDMDGDSKPDIAVGNFTASTVSILKNTPVSSGGRHSAGATTEESSVAAVSEVTIAPNPNRGTFLIKGNLNVEDGSAVTIEIFNMMGQLVYKSQATTNQGRINEQVMLSSELANGMYILSVLGGTEHKVLHVVISR